jgi:hypothetical protein
MLPLTRYQVKLLPWLYWEIYLLEKVGYLSWKAKKAIIWDGGSNL